MQRISLFLAVLLLAQADTGCTSQTKSSYHLSRGNRYYESGELPKAEIEYLNVLRYDPANEQAYGRLGLIYYDEGRLQRALFFLRKATGGASTNLEMRLKLGFIYSSAGLSTQALAQANFILDKNPQDAEAPLLLAESSLQSNAVHLARQRLQEMARRGDRANIEVALGNLALREHDWLAAGAAYRQAEKLEPNSPTVHGALGMLAWGQGDLQQADAEFKKAADASPARAVPRMQYARFKMQTGDLAGARTVLKDTLKQADDYVPAYMLLAEIAAHEKKYDECDEQLVRVQALDPDNFDALLFQGRMDLERHQPDKAVAELDRLAHGYPQVAQVHYQLALACLAANNPSDAAKSLDRALDVDPDFTEATLLLAQIQIRSGNANPAILSLEQLRAKKPQLVQAQLILADAYRMQGRIDDAVAIYRALEKTYPTNAQVALLHGAALLQLSDNAGARKQFERVLQAAPNNIPAIEQLVDLDLAEKQFAAAQQRVDAEMQKFPAKPDFQVLLAKIYLAQTNRTQAEAALQKALQLDPGNQDAPLLLGQIYSDAGQNDRALAQLATLLATNSQNTGAWMLAAKINSDKKNYPDAAAAYERALKVDPKFGPALNNLAYIYTEQVVNLDRAYDLAQRARELLPYDPSTADTLGWVNFKRGSYQSALALLQESAAKMPNVPEVQFHFGMASYMAGNEAKARPALQRASQAGGDFPGRAECQACLAVLDIQPEAVDAAARATLEKRVASKPDDPVAQLRLAHIYLHDGNNAKAAAGYAAVLQALPKNLEAMVALTKIYAATDEAKAYVMAKAANKLAPYDPEVLHLMGGLAFKNGDYQLSASTLQQAAQNQSADGALQFDYAQAAYSVGRVAEARAALQNAVGANLPDASAAKARDMLELIDLGAAPAKAAAAGSRIAEALKADPNYPPALMAQAAACDFNSDLSGVTQACEKVLARYPDFLPAEKQLARLYVADPAKADRAYALAAKVRDAKPDDAAMAKVMGMVLVQRGDYGRALALLKESAANPQADAEVYYYLGAAQFHLKNRTDSKASLEQALSRNLSAQLTNSAKQMLSELK
ncbi:MAG TPA: tetratricopeptide repeat protein [Verrucomicrobiae bacterium]